MKIQRRFQTLQTMFVSGTIVCSCASNRCVAVGGIRTATNERASTSVQLMGLSASGAVTRRNEKLRIGNIGNMTTPVSCFPPVLQTRPQCTVSRPYRTGMTSNSMFHCHYRVIGAVKLRDDMTCRYKAALRENGAFTAEAYVTEVESARSCL